VKHNLRLFIALLLAPLAVLHAADPSKPNIVFFLVDDLGWSDVGCYGSKFHETPHIDQLAREGVKFTNAYAACHVCSPTRASILTGKYPARLKLTDWLPGRRNFPFQKLLNAPIKQQLPFEEITLAEALKDQGYATAIFGKWHLGEKPSDPTAHGFDLHRPDMPSNWRTFHGPFGMKTYPSQKGDYLTDRITDDAVKWIESTKDRPFFMYLSHFAVHDPIEGRPDLVEKYKRKHAATQWPEGPDFVLEGNPDDPTAPTREELGKLIQTPEFAAHKVLPRDTIKIRQKQDNIEFAAMVESVDESLGRVVKKLDELGLIENTIIVFFSDNGGMAAMNVGNPARVVPEAQIDKAYATSCLPLRGAKGWLYEGGIRVPMIVKWPQQGKAGTLCATPVSSVDFVPTLLDMIGQRNAIPPKVDGISIAPLVRGEAIADRAIYWHFPHYSNHGGQSPSGAIREGRYKLIESFENGTRQLFDLETDLGEQQDLSQSMPERALELQRKLQAWRESVGASIMEPNPDFDPTLKASESKRQKKKDIGIGTKE
jgi:arylsulfatase A